jgi:integrase
MVAIYKDGKSGRWHISFRFGGKQVHKSLKTRNEKKAAAWKERIEETLLDLERGRFELSPNADFWEYVKSDGKRTNKLVIASSLTIQGLFRWYFDSLPEGTKVKKTGKVETIHANHFKRLLGAKTELSAITGQDLQEKYVNKRAKEKGRYGQRIDPSTIKKEICTFRMAWNRGYRQKVSGIHGPCPCVDLQYPKDRQKPPFQTRDQIEKTIARGGLSEADVKEIWDSLFLDQRQIEEVLEHVRNKPTRRHYFYPLLVFVSHTGARLSECLRSMVSDFDFCEKKVRIQEKKRRKSEETYRWVCNGSV